MNQVRRCNDYVSAGVGERLAWYIGTAYNLLAGVKLVFGRYGGFDYVTGETDFDEKASDEIRTGAGGRRFDVLNDWRCISSRRADRRCSTVADRWTGSPGNAG
jgi:hypothetical protein